MSTSRYLDPHSIFVYHFRSVFKVNSLGVVSDVLNGDLAYEWSGSGMVKLSQDSGLAVGAPTWNDCTADPCR